MNVANPALLSGRPQDEFRTIGLVGLAHAVSHFHHLLLPPPGLLKHKFHGSNIARVLQGVGWGDRGERRVG